MSANVTYLFGAGASFHAIPLVNNFTERFKIFCDHLNKNIKPLLSEDEYKEFVLTQNEFVNNIQKHYTIDTYAKKLFYKEPALHTNKEYQVLIKYLSIYFIYEQLKVDIQKSCNYFLMERMVFSDTETEYEKNIKRILVDFDYRYDSFFASILKHDINKNLVIPKNINFISWNYDFQMEIAYMNFSGCNLNAAIDSLNVTGTPQQIFERPVTDSHLIKLNGTAGFLSNNKFGEMFDFSEHTLDDEYFRLCKDILLKKTDKIQNSIRFSWEEHPLKNLAIELAEKKINNSDVVIVIGYSFPYFNREVDRKIFDSVRKGKNLKVYIQSPADSINSVVARFNAIAPSITPELFTETDQFLIPNEL